MPWISYVGVKPEKRIEGYKPRFADRVTVIHLRFVRDGYRNADFHFGELNFAADFYFKRKARAFYV